MFHSLGLDLVEPEAKVGGAAGENGARESATI